MQHVMSSLTHLFLLAFFHQLQKRLCLPRMALISSKSSARDLYASITIFRCRHEVMGQIARKISVSKCSRFRTGKRDRPQKFFDDFPTVEPSALHHLSIQDFTLFAKHALRYD
jgi:hypothetical protein